MLSSSTHISINANCVNTLSASSLAIKNLLPIPLRHHYHTLHHQSTASYTIKHRSTYTHTQSHINASTNQQRPFTSLWTYTNTYTPRNHHLKPLNLSTPPLQHSISPSTSSTPIFTFYTLFNEQNQPYKFLLTTLRRDFSGAAAPQRKSEHDIDADIERENQNDAHEAHASYSESRTATKQHAATTPASNPQAQTSSIRPVNVDAAPQTLRNGPSPSPSSNTSVSVVELPLGTRIWNRVKKEAKHYWAGSKLLWAETKISFNILKEVLHGKELTRRERRQLQRTASDLLRLIPFIPIVLIPLAEFALPFLLYLFPNMLPSTFADHHSAEERLKKQLALKIDMAKFLQETTVLMTADILAKRHPQGLHGKVDVNEFQDFMNRVKAGQPINSADIIKYSALFSEDFTLENLNRRQLEAMCSLLEIRPFGSDWVLRYKLADRLRKLKLDDKQIDKEGVESLNQNELIDACRQRGIHTGKGVEYMRKKLKDWIQLSIYSDVPVPLLILSRAFALSRADAVARGKEAAAAEADDLTAGLVDTIAHLPENVVEDTQHHVVTRSAGSIDDAELKLRILQEQQAKVEAERKLQAQQQAAAAAAGVKEKPIMAPVDLQAEHAELKEIKEDNDEVEEDIDQAHAAEIAPQAVNLAQTGSATATPPPAPSAAQTPQQPPTITPPQPLRVEEATGKTESAPASVPPTAATATPPSATTPVSDKHLHKQEAKVDRFNDKLEQYLENIERDLHKLSLAEMKHREEEERKAKIELDAQQQKINAQQPQPESPSASQQTAPSQKQASP